MSEFSSLAFFQAIPRAYSSHHSPRLPDADIRPHDSIDHQLGYCGQDRFVMFFYEPRLQKFRWRDTRNIGLGCGAWPADLAGVQAEATARGVTLGQDNKPGDHVLLVDRVSQQACFAFREEAQEFLARRGVVPA